MAYIKIDAEGRVTAASKTHHCGDGEIEVTIPEEIGLEAIHEYRYENGRFVHDPKEVTQLVPKPKIEERIEMLETAMKAIEEGIASV